MARVTWSMAPLAQAAALLNLGVAEGAAGAVVTVQSHVPLRGLQLLTAFTLVFHGVGLQRVPVGRSAQCPALPAAACTCHGPRNATSGRSAAPEVFVTLCSKPYHSHLPVPWGQKFLPQLPLATRCPTSAARCTAGHCCGARAFVPPRYFRKQKSCFKSSQCSPRVLEPC